MQAPAPLGGCGGWIRLANLVIQERLSQRPVSMAAERYRADINKRVKIYGRDVASSVELWDLSSLLYTESGT